jgi:hypothetical protein
MKDSQLHTRVKHVTNASIKEERGVSPNLVIKKEPVSDLPVDVIPNTTVTMFRTVTENGQEIIELLDSDNDSDSEMVSEDKGMSSDTMVGDFDFKMDSDDDNEEPHQEKSNNTDLGSSLSDSDCDPDLPDLDEASSNWLDDGISSTVKQGPIKITRQCTVNAVEYISDLPSYWPVPRNKRAYVVDLSDPKFNIYDKNGRLMTVDALIKNAVSAHFWIHSHCISSTGCLLLGAGLMDGLHWQWPQGFSPKNSLIGFWTRGRQRNPLSKKPSHMYRLFSLRVYQSCFG